MLERHELPGGDGCSGHVPPSGVAETLRICLQSRQKLESGAERGACFGNFSGGPVPRGRLPSPDPRLHGGLQARGLVLSTAGHPHAHVHGIGGHPGVPPAVAGTERAAAIGAVVGAIGVRAGGEAVRGWVRLGPPETRFAVPDEHGHCHPPRGQRVGSQLQGFILPLPLALVPSVLEPDFHLRGGKLEHAGEVLPFRSGEVFLLLKSPLQFKHLSLGE